MEQIPKEVIEMAEDFFAHSSVEEREKMLKIYFIEQPDLSACLIRILKTKAGEKVREICKYWYLIIYRSYQYYGIKIPLIKEAFITNSITNLMSPQKAQELQNELQNSFSTLLKDHINQDNLLAYIHSDQTVNVPNGALEIKSINMTHGIFCIELIILVLNEAMSKSLEKEAK